VSWQKYLLIPKLMWYGVRASRNSLTSWDGFWASVQGTGPDGDVLWDAGSESELKGTLAQLLPRLDSRLPIIDVGCGNGRYTRSLAPYFSQAIGIDLSPRAIDRAREESRDVANVSYRVLDVSRPGVGRALAAELDDANVFVRGVLHVLPPKDRLVMVENLRNMLGQRGTLYLVETALKGDPLDHLEYQGATRGSIPGPLLKCIVNGVRPPEHFDESQYHKYLTDDQWETLACGPTILHTLPMHNKTGIDELPSFFAIARPRGLGMSTMPSRGRARADG
jgi:SAM-dependent methyltransferase